MSIQRWQVGITAQGHILVVESDTGDWVEFSSHAREVSKLKESLTECMEGREFHANYAEELEGPATALLAERDALKASNKELLEALNEAHCAGELGGWEECPEGMNCVCCDRWRKARSMRDAAIALNQAKG